MPLDNYGLFPKTALSLPRILQLKWEEEQSQRRLALDNRERDLGRQIELVEAQKAAQQAAQAEVRNNQGIIFLFLFRRESGPASRSVTQHLAFLPCLAASGRPAE